ncbi:hypothetical protein AC249_AIPGENE24116 [Exaiptasia diaphana]|nr:hypothetical protein AC249_AIPGENE24116 [Exaiptasia diaphana]
MNPSGFLGSTNDAASYRLMTPIGPGQPLSLPVGAKFLADKGYPGVDPLLTPVRAIQMRAGFLGSTNDAASYRLMTPIGPGQPLSLPVGAKFLADKGYPGVDPLLTPVRAIQMRVYNMSGRVVWELQSRAAGERL